MTPKRLRMRLTSCGLCAVVAASAYAQPLAPDAIIADRYVTTDGSIQSDVAVLLGDGKIKRVVPAAEFTPTENTARYPNAVVGPGLIDLLATVGVQSGNGETVRAIDPDASIIDAVDLAHRDFRAALAAGVTSVMLVPAPVNLISGAAAVVKTSSPGAAFVQPASAPAQLERNADSSRLLTGDGPLMGALGPMLWLPDREPTSRVGALAMLREFLHDARTGGGSLRAQKLVADRVRLVVVCEEAMDVDAAIRTFGPLSADLVIAYNGDAHELGVDIARETAGVILGPFDSSTPPRTLATPAAFTQAGASVALAGRLPEGPAVGPRLTAALAVRYGMKPDQARAAITSTAARIAGVDRRVGAIKPGLDADLVIFSDDPLRFDSRPLAVYVDGVRVWSELGRRANTSDGYGVSP